MSQTTYTKIPWLSKTNVLLLKDDVGKAKPSAYSLPKREFIYGRPLDRDPEDAKQVTMRWRFHDSTRDALNMRDFKKLNKLSVSSGLHNSKEYSSFRKENDAATKIHKGTNQFSIQLPESDFVYGKPNRPSTPMNYVMGNLYGLESEKHINEIYQGRMEYLSRREKYIPKTNKSCQLNKMFTQSKLQQIAQKNNKELFKLKRFDFVQPRTNSYSVKSLSRAANASKIGIEDSPPKNEVNEQVNPI